MQLLVPASWIAQPPRAREIHLCYFPYQEENGKPGLSVHPVLVLAIGRKPDGSNPLLVAYGSSKGIAGCDPTNVVVDPAVHAGTGLTKITRFQLARRAWVTFDRSYFLEAATTKSPRIGVFPVALDADFEAAKAQVLALPGANWLNPRAEP